MRSSDGVGMTPPNVLGAPNPQSSVMMRRMLGAPLGGTTRGGHQAFDCRAFSLMTPPNFGSGGGSCLPLMVVVASGEPGTPVVCWADAATQLTARSPAPKRMVRLILRALSAVRLCLMSVFFMFFFSLGLVSGVLKVCYNAFTFHLVRADHCPQRSLTTPEPMLRPTICCAASLFLFS